MNPEILPRGILLIFPVYGSESGKLSASLEGVIRDRVASNLS